MSQVDRSSAPVSNNYWRSLAELEGSPEFEAFVAHEFAEPVADEPADSPNRRRFMQLMGASFALAGVATGCRWERDRVLPQSRRPQGTVPGETRHFATSMELGGAATGLVVTSYDGRPIKVEGNPLHPDSEGAASVFHQASILGLYDPDRSTQPLRRDGNARVPATWEDFDRVLGAAVARLGQAGGRGLAVLARPTSSPSMRDLRRRLAQAMPGHRYFEWEPFTGDSERSGSTLAFGQPQRAVLHLDRAEVLVCLDADPIVTHPAALAHARDLMRARQPESGRLSRVYAIESSFSATGVIADHRLALRSELVLPFAMALDAAISARAQALPEHGPAQIRPDAAFLAEPKIAALLAAMVRDLLGHVGKGLIVAGPQQPDAVHALCHRLNVLLGNVGSTVDFIDDPAGDRPTHLASIQTLASSLAAGEVDTLLILGGNPVYDAPAETDLGALLAKAKLTIHASLADDETSARADWHVPTAHFLEAWGDGLGWDGTLTLAQPLIAPLHGGRSELEVLAALVGDRAIDGLEILRRTHAATLGDDRRWARAVQDGLVAGPRSPAQVTLRALPRFTLTDRQRGGLAVSNGALELTFMVDARVFDGRYANNGWLQELPDPFSKLTWDNAALVAPRTAEELGIADGGVITLSIDGRSVTMPALHAPGQAPGSIRVTLGHGRTRAGMVGGSPELGVEPVGVDTYRLRSIAAPYIAAGLSAHPTGAMAPLASTQHLHAIDQLGKDGEAARLPAIVREATLADVGNPEYSARHEVHHPPLLNLWQDPVSYEGRKWGMSIDLTKCIGCNACVVACTAENNVPVVGRDLVRRGREMHWIRIDRYYRGSPDEPEVTYQPVACQHCENAPCEQVCPVGATMHSSEGLNDMVYNRCIGTRYCSNNCPYKVRRYNYFNYNLAYSDPKNQTQRLALNPEVTVRARGVMEKCSFCIQRIQHAKIGAKNARRGLLDGEVMTACQQSCPTQAIVFGDLNDLESRVVAERKSRRAYELLGELNNRPRVAYLARVRNPHPELAPAPVPDHGAHGAEPDHPAPAGGHHAPEHG